VSLVLSKTKTVSQSGGRPQVAVELSPKGALAAAFPAPGQPPVYAFASLPAGAISPGIGEPNIRKADAVAAAIRSVLDQVATRTHDVTLVLPDTSARVFVLDFDSLPTKASEAVPVLRFRLRKMVPFDVEHAALSYQMLVHEQVQGQAAVKVLVTLMPGPILAEYEIVVRAAGYEPGAVLPSSLAALAALDSMEPILAANLTEQALTTSITSGQDLLLYRTVELPEDSPARIAEVQRSIAVAAAYFEDKVMVRPHELHYAGNISAAEFAGLIGDDWLTVVEMAPHPETGAVTALGSISLAGISGALAGVS
jgi:type IV pilus assembly protein PilM